MSVCILLVLVLEPSRNIGLTVLHSTDNEKHRMFNRPIVYTYFKYPIRYTIYLRRMPIAMVLTVWTDWAMAVWTFNMQECHESKAHTKHILCIRNTVFFSLVWFWLLSIESISLFISFSYFICCSSWAQSRKTRINNNEHNLVWNQFTWIFAQNRKNVDETNYFRGKSLVLHFIFASLRILTQR